MPDAGEAGAKEWFTVERLFIAARCCGAARRLLDLAADWSKEQTAFGSRIADYQGVSSPLADSLTELLAARLLTYHAAHAFDALTDRKVVHGKVAAAKLYASEMAGRVADRAVQIFGGRGYMTPRCRAPEAGRDGPPPRRRRGAGRVAGRRFAVIPGSFVGFSSSGAPRPGTPRGVVAASADAGHPRFGRRALHATASP